LSLLEVGVVAGVMVLAVVLVALEPEQAFL
jgi:hypothetical protein